MAGIPSLRGSVSVHPSLLLWLSILCYWDMHLTFCFLLAAGIHEMGHGLALLCMGRPPCRMELSALGAQLEIPALGYGQSALALAAGPIASLLLGLTLPLCPTAGLLSLGLGLFNLLPLRGLDGGELLYNLLCLRLSPERSDRITSGISILLSALVVPVSLILSLRLSLGLWLPAASLLLLMKSLDAGRL